MARQLRRWFWLALLALIAPAVLADSYDSDAFDTDAFDTDAWEFTAAAAWVLTGLPIGWEPVTDILTEQEFLTIKRQECDGDAVWAKWRAGTSVSPRGTSNCVLQLSIVRQEADGSAVWARWSPGVNNRGSANLQIDVRAALTADFVVN